MSSTNALWIKTKSKYDLKTLSDHIMSFADKNNMIIVINDFNFCTSFDDTRNNLNITENFLYFIDKSAKDVSPNQFFVIEDAFNYALNIEKNSGKKLKSRQFMLLEEKYLYNNFKPLNSLIMYLFNNIDNIECIEFYLDASYPSLKNEFKEIQVLNRNLARAIVESIKECRPWTLETTKFIIK